MSSHSALGGHVRVYDHVNIGWGAGVHQFCKVGRHAMVSACSKLVQDVPPFMLADGSPAEVVQLTKSEWRDMVFSRMTLTRFVGSLKRFINLISIDLRQSIS